MIFVDTNVLIDVSSNDPAWADWSQEQLDLAARNEDLAINEIVYAELSVGYTTPDQVDRLLISMNIAVDPTPKRALFLAGKAFQHYRRAGGTRTGVLADFFIGAHAVIADAALITRDARRYLTYFPGIELVTPSLN